MADIVLVNPPVNFDISSDYQMDHPITGSLVLASICETKGYSVAFFDDRDRFWTYGFLRTGNTGYLTGILGTVVD